MTDQRSGLPGDRAGDDVPDSVAFGPGVGAPGRTRRPRTRTLVTGGLSAALVGGVVYGGIAVAGFLSGGGTQPEDVLPATTIGFVKVDLDPSAGQKVDALRLLRRFPELDADSDDLKAVLLEDLLDENPYGLTYDRDIAPWLGDRAAVAALPAPERADGAAAVVVLEFTDEQKMTATLDRIAGAAEDDPEALLEPEPAAPGEAPEEPHDLLDEPPTQAIAYAVRDGYVFLGEDQGVVDEAVAADQVLADTATFAADEQSVDGAGKIALAWADLGAVYEAVPAADRKGLQEALGERRPSGRVTAALGVGSDHVEMVGRTSDLEAVGIDSVAAGSPSTELLGGLPADADAALSVTGLGESLMRVYDELGTEPFFGSLDDEAQQMGVRLPDDLGVVFGTEFAAAAHFSGGEGDVVIRADTDDRSRAMEALVPLLDLGAEPDVTVSEVDGGYVAATSPAWAKAAAERTGGLGDDDRFTRAVPDAADANAVFFFDFGMLDDLFGADDGDSVLAPLQAFGLTVAGDDGDARFTAGSRCADASAVGLSAHGEPRNSRRHRDVPTAAGKSGGTAWNLRTTTHWTLTRKWSPGSRSHCCPGSLRSGYGGVAARASHRGRLSSSPRRATC